MASITLSTAPLGYTENSEEIALDAAALFDAAGLSVNSLDGFELSVSFANGGLPADRLIVGVNAAEGVGLDGRIIRLNNTEVATFSGGIGTEPLVIRFNAAATLSAVQPLLRSLSYVNLSDNLPPTGDRQITLQFQPVGQASLGTASKTITVTGVEDAPVVYSSLPLYSNSAVQLTDNEAAPEAPWFTYQDTVTYPSEVPVVGGQEFLGGTANRSLSSGTVLVTDNQAYAGFSNRRANYSQLGNLLFASSATVTLESINPNSPFPVLDRQAGFQLSFSAQIAAEARNGDADKNNDGIDDRAGFTVLVVSSDQKAIELGFWQDEIWAQNDGTSQLDPSLEPDAAPSSDFRSLFTHGEGASFNTAQLTDYGLVVKGDRYQLFANNALLLSGALRDYSAFPAPPQVVSTPLGNKTINLPDPYETPNFIFLGDNTPTASATVTLSQIALQQPNANPTIEVSGGVVTRLPQLQLGDPDGLEQATVVLLSVPSGNLEVTGNNAVTVTKTNQGQLLTGSLAAINGLLDDSQNLSYQPTQGFTGNVPITVVVDPLLPSRVRHDFDGDGNSDLLWFDPTSGLTVLWNMEGNTFNGRGAIVANALPDTNFQIQGTGDFDLDGKTDILWRNTATGNTTVWLMDGGTFKGAANIMAQEPLDAGWFVESVADINRDGQSDLLWRNRSTNTIVAWYLDSGANGSNIQRIGGAVLNAPGLEWQIQGMGDFNGDTRPDIVWRNTINAATAIWYLDGLNLLPGSGNALGSNIPEAQRPGLGWEIQGIGDYNRDGKADVIWRNPGINTTVIWNMDNTELIGGAQVFPNVLAPLQLGLN